VGGLAIKGEMIWARKTNRDYDLAKANSCLNSQSLGWMITVVQNIGPTWVSHFAWTSSIRFSPALSIRSATTRP